MVDLVWTEPALYDLNEIGDYIALNNPSASFRLMRKVVASIERLARYPESGRVIPEIGPSPFREVIVGPCRIFYRIKQNKVFILHVMRGERLFRKYLIEQRNQES